MLLKGFPSEGKLAPQVTDEVITKLETRGGALARP